MAYKSQPMAYLNSKMAKSPRIAHTEANKLFNFMSHRWQ